MKIEKKPLFYYNWVADALLDYPCNKTPEHKLLSSFVRHMVQNKEGVDIGSRIETAASHLIIPENSSQNPYCKK